MPRVDSEARRLIGHLPARTTEGQHPAVGARILRLRPCPDEVATLPTAPGPHVDDVVGHRERQVGVVDQDNFLPGNGSNHFGLGKAEFFQNKGEGLTQARLEDALTVLDRVSFHESLPTDSAEREKLDAPTHRLEIVTTSGLITLEAVKEEAGALIRRAGSPHIYRMHDTVFDRLFPSPSPDAE